MAVTDKYNLSAYALPIQHIFKIAPLSHEHILNNGTILNMSMDISDM
jgi:hypothetical protein